MGQRRVAGMSAGKNIMALKVPKLVTPRGKHAGFVICCLHDVSFRTSYNLMIIFGSCCCSRHIEYTTRLSVTCLTTSILFLSNDLGFRCTCIRLLPLFKESGVTCGIYQSEACRRRKESPKGHTKRCITQPVSGGIINSDRARFSSPRISTEISYLAILITWATEVINLMR